MLSLIHRTSAIVAALLMVCLFSFAAPKVVAANDPSDPEKSSVRVPSPSGEAASADAELKVPRVLYAAFDAPLSIPPETVPEPASRPRSVSKLLASVNATGTLPGPVPVPTVRQSTVASTAPMTPGEKFEAWFHSRFLSFGAYGSAVVNGMWKELQDNDDFKKDTVENYFADSMTRAARSYAFGTTAGFFEKAVFASLFRQDPRYHRSGKTGAGGKIGYAVTRVFVTQGDRCGCHQFNASFLLGGAVASGAANLWERRERTGPMHTLSRYYNHIAITALFNVVKEFVGGQ